MDEPELNGPGADVEFFGVKLRVNNPHLAALLNSDVSDDVQVIGRRARDVVAHDRRRPVVAVQPKLVAVDSDYVNFSVTDDDT